MSNTRSLNEPGLELRQSSLIIGPIEDSYIQLLMNMMKQDLVNDQPKVSGLTALHRAVKAKNTDKVHLLKLAGANPLLKCNANKSPLDLAQDLPNSAKEKNEILRLLTTELTPCNDHPLCMCNDIALIKLLNVNSNIERKSPSI